MAIPESYFKGCQMEPVVSEATDYQQAFYDVSIAYTGTAKNVTKCNDRAAEGLALQRKLIERHKQPQ